MDQRVVVKIKVESQNGLEWLKPCYGPQPHQLNNEIALFIFVFHGP